MMNRKVFVVLETLLLVIFITATIILAQRLKFDPDKGFVPTAGIRVDGVKKAHVEIADKRKDETPVTIDYLTESSYNVLITKQNRQDWKDNISVTPQFITRIYPVLFPKDINKELKISDIINVYPVKKGDVFFYTKVNSSKNLELHKFSLNQNLLGESAEDKKIFEFTLTDKLNIVPSPSGEKLLLELNDSKFVINTDSTFTSFGKVIDISASYDQIIWAPSERFLIFSQQETIFSYDLTNQQKYQIAQNDTKTSFRLLDVDSNKLLLFKTEKKTIPTTQPSLTDLTEEKTLLQSNLDGKNLEKIKLNQDITGLKKGHILSGKQSLILEYDNLIKIVNTENNVLVEFKGEKVILNDTVNELVVVKSDGKFLIYDTKNEKSFEMKTETQKISNLMPYFKNSNFFYTINNDENKSRIVSNYITGNQEINLDEGKLQPLIAWKKNDFVRLYYTKQVENSLGNQMNLYSIEFEN